MNKEYYDTHRLLAILFLIIIVLSVCILVGLMFIDISTSSICNMGGC